MRDFIAYTITGLVTGGLYAIVACGLTLTYTTTGIFNWAHGAIVAVGGFAYWQLVVGWGLPWPFAAALCILVIGPLFGAGVERGIMHRLEGTSEAIRMVVTLALMLGLLATINWIWDPAELRRVPKMFPGDVVTIFGQRIPYDDLAVIAAALVVALVLRWLLYRTRAGVEMRASVDDRGLMTLVGASVGRTATVAWMIGSTLAVVAGVLIVPGSSVVASSLVLLIVNAYAAAVIGKLKSLPMTFLGAIILGLASAYGQGYVGSRQDFPGNQYLVGLVNALPVVVLFIALQLLPQDRLRGSRQLRIREVSVRPSWPGVAALAGGAVLATIAVAPLLSPGDLNTMTRVWGLAIVGLSLVPLVGYAGRLAVCPLAFAAIGAMAVHHLTPGGSPAGLVWAGVLGALAGALVSLTAIRLSGLYLALATAAFAVIVDSWILRMPSFTVFGYDLWLFEGGTLAIRRFRLPGIDTQSDHAFFVFGALVFAVLAVVVTAVRRSDLGLRLIALRDSPVAYATLGFNQRQATVAVFALSGSLAAIGGAVFGAAIQRPAQDPFSFFSGLSVIIAVVIAGVGSIGSAIAAGVFLGGPTVANLFPSISQLSNIAIGAAGVNLGNEPNGAMPKVRQDFEPVGRRQARAVLGGGLAVVVTAYVLAVTDTIGNWPLVAVLIATLIAMPVLARVVSATDTLAERDRVADGLSAPPELLGLALPVTDTDRRVLERELGVSDLEPAGTTDA